MPAGEASRDPGPRYGLTVWAKRGDAETGLPAQSATQRGIRSAQGPRRPLRGRHGLPPNPITLRRLRKP